MLRVKKTLNELDLILKEDFKNKNKDWSGNNEQNIETAKTIHEAFRKEKEKLEKLEEEEKRKLRDIQLNMQSRFYDQINYSPIPNHPHYQWNNQLYPQQV